MEGTDTNSLIRDAEMEDPGPFLLLLTDTRSLLFCMFL